MAKPKPPEDSEKISVYAPVSLANRIRELALQSNKGNGIALSVYIVALMEEAAASGVTIDLVQHTRVIRPAAREAESSLSRKKAG